MKLLVTGGAGYIGSHCVLRLLQEGHEVVIFDNFSEGSRETVCTLSELKFSGRLADVVQGDLLHPEDLQRTFDDHSFEAVFHFAALTRVEESVQYPELYYRVNVVGTLNLLEAMRSSDVKRLIFSSTAAVYGEPQYTPIDEKHPLNPINPYGRSKQMAEEIIQDFDHAYGIRSVCLRYFNVVGSSSLGCIGDRRECIGALIPSLLRAAQNPIDSFCLFGNDYPTRDGSCFRDCVSAEDLVDAHVRTLDFLLKERRGEVFNLGSGCGRTIYEMLALCEQVLKRKISVSVRERRPGDLVGSCASTRKAEELLGWRARQPLEESIRLAWAWRMKRSQKVTRG